MQGEYNGPQSGRCLGNDSQGADSGLEALSSGHMKLSSGHMKMRQGGCYRG